jgi:hypothetical protein
MRALSRGSRKKPLKEGRAKSSVALAALAELELAELAPGAAGRALDGTGASGRWYFGAKEQPHNPNVSPTNANNKRAMGIEHHIAVKGHKKSLKVGSDQRRAKTFYKA